jgi:cobalt-zinc-cadmium efflux system protein
MLIGIIILSGSFRVLKEAVHLLNEGAPDDAASDEVTAALATLPGVKSVHDTHVWALDPSFRVLSAHIVLEDQPLSRTAALMSDAKRLLRERYRVEHTTIQFECADCEQCSGLSDCEEGELHDNH